MPHLITTLGPKSASEMGIILPHEHVFVDLRTWDQPGYAQAEAKDVIAKMKPELVRAREAGITALAECSAVGVGRRADLLKAVSEASDFPLLAPTGIYREPWVPDWAHAWSEDALYQWMLSELEGEIEGSGVQAGWIKLSAGDDGITATETKILRAACRAAIPTSATIGSHTIRGAVVRRQLDILEEVGYTPTRFIWIHASAEPEIGLNLEMAQRGAWIEYDFIGQGEEADQETARRIQWMLEAGFGDHLLISHDAGWYNPANPEEPARPFTHVVESFIPRLRSLGVGEAAIRQIFYENPFRAFAR